MLRICKEQYFSSPFKFNYTKNYDLNLGQMSANHINIDEDLTVTVDDNGANFFNGVPSIEV